MYRYQFKRLLNNKFKRNILIIFILFPSLQILQYFHYFYTISEFEPIEEAMLQKHYTTFLSANTRGHAMNSTLLWLLPIYLLLFINEACIEDFIYGYKNAIVSRIGCKKYFISKIGWSFWMAFFSMLFALLLNYLFATIAFAKGFYNPISHLIGQINPWLDFSYEHPILINFLYILIMSIIAGLISMSSSTIAIIFHDRRIVYTLVSIIWLILVMKKKSIMCAIQPFCEYDIKFTALRFIEVLLIYVPITYLGYLYEVKNYDKVH